MTNRLPSDALTRPRFTKRAVIVAGSVLVALALVTAGLLLAAPAWRTSAAPQPTTVFVPAAQCDGTSTGQGICTSDEQQQAANAAETQLEADNAAKAKAAADALAAQQQAAAEQAAKDAAAKSAQPKSEATTAGAPGSRVPFIKSDDPNNANGGDYEDPGTFCQSHSASGNPPVCD
jgi:hypothetical protein